MKFAQILHRLTTAAVQSKKIGKNTIKKNLYRIIPCAVLAMLVCFSPLLSRVTLAYEVKLDGKTIGYVSDSSVVNKAANKISNQINGTDVQLTTGTSYNFTVVSSNQLDDIDSISSALIENSSQIKNGCGIYVNSKLVAACSENDTAQRSLDMLKKLAMKKTASQNGEFVDKIELKQGVFANNDILSGFTLGETLKKLSLSFRTYNDSKKTEAIAFETITTEDDSQYEGYKRIDTEGVNGVKTTVIRTVYTDGIKQSSSQLSSSVTKQPISERVTIGTKQPERVDNAADAKFCWPVEKNYSGYVSTWFSAGSHNGIDIATIGGTPIFAASSGTVSEVYNYASNGYGNYFVIDHGNGLYSMYAHCQEMFVEVGQNVAMGEQVATVGSTGRSSGNHLHFEVYYNGYKVDPASYLGLN